MEACAVCRKDVTKESAGNLLEYVRSLSPDEELASAVEKVVEKRGKIHRRTHKL